MRYEEGFPCKRCKTTTKVVTTQGPECKKCSKDMKAMKLLRREYNMKHPKSRTYHDSENFRPRSSVGRRLDIGFQMLEEDYLGLDVGSCTRTHVFRGEPKGG